MSDRDNVEQVSWNLSQMLIVSIHSLLTKGSTNALAGDFRKSFNCFKEIRILIYPHLNEVELKKLKDIEDNFSSLMNIANKTAPNSFKDESPEYLKARSGLSKSLDEYREMTMSLLDKYGFGVGRKQDASKMFDDFPKEEEDG